jgi:thiol-disulfide isomerase/thioredoxin
MKKKLLLYLIAIMIIAGCKSNAVRISGTLVSPDKGKYIYLDELKSDEVKRVDSVRIAEDGTFGFKREINFPSFYLLKLSDRNFMTMLLTPGEQINLSSHFDSLNYPTSVTGSEGTELMNEYNRKLRNTITKLSGLSDIYRQNVNSPGLPAVIESLDSIAQTYLDDMNSYTKSYIDRNITSLVSLIALYQQVAPNVYVLSPSKDFRYYIKVDSALSLLYSDYEPVKTLHEQVKQLVEGINTKEAGTPGAGEGAIAPEIILPSPAGDTIKLSSTRGSVVLLDFWASWCAPCRQENPNLVRAYNQYHRKGFQIYQVSLDKTKDAWIKGIEDDQLNKWIHVSDIQYWNSKVVQLYKIESIPSNFLLDKEGRVIATNLRGEALQIKLAELFKQ